MSCHANELPSIVVDRARPTDRQGFTLVELIVAIIILSVGVLGLASTAAVVTRQIGGGAQQTRAAALAQTRFEELRSIPCADYSLPFTGTSESGGFSESWAVTDFVGSTNTAAPGRIFTDSVFYEANGKDQVRVFRSMRTC